MSTSQRFLTTPKGKIFFPTYVPVTTFGADYPLDNLIRPYLPRLAQAMMVSFHYAQEMSEKPRIPVMIDSGGFASLFEGSKIVQERGIGVLEVQTEDGVRRLHPLDVLDFQERNADVAFSLDFIIPPGMEKSEACRRLELTMANALWAVGNRRRKGMPLYGCIQAWDAESARECARCYVGQGFDGIAIGGMVPRVRDRELVLSIVEAVRHEIPELPLHLFGLGKPDFVDLLFKAGVDSVDSSSYVKLAANGRLWGNADMRIDNPSPTDRLHLALCNLALATSRALPLSASRIFFSTQLLKLRGSTSLTL